METSTILGEIASQRSAGGRACPVAVLITVLPPDHLRDLEIALADPAKYPPTAVARVFRRIYPQSTIHDKAVRAHQKRECRCFR